MVHVNASSGIFDASGDKHMYRGGDMGQRCFPNPHTVTCWGDRHNADIIHVDDSSDLFCNPYNSQIRPITVSPGAASGKHLPATSLLRGRSQALVGDPAGRANGGKPASPCENDITT